MSHPDFDALARSGDPTQWRAAIDGAFSLTDKAHREATLRILRSVYEERLAPQFQAVPWGPRLAERADSAARTKQQNASPTASRTSARTTFAAMEKEPRTAIVFRLILGYSTAELAAALKLLGVTTSKAALDTIERGKGVVTAQRKTVIAPVAAVTGVIDRELFALDEVSLSRTSGAVSTSSTHTRAGQASDALPTVASTTATSSTSATWTAAGSLYAPPTRKRPVS